jgi:hypothetical protein
MAATTFTATGGDYMRPYYGGGGYAGRAVIRTFPETTAGTFVRGEPLIQDTGSHLGGGVIVAANDPTAGVVGVACHGATGSQNTAWGALGKYGVGSRTDITALAAGNAGSLGAGVAGSLGNGVGGCYENVSNVATLVGNGVTKGLVQVWLLTQLFMARVVDTQAVSADFIGLQYGLEKDTSHLIWRVDTGDTSNKVVQITDILDQDGDVNGWVVFKFLAAANRLFGER